MTTPVGPVGEPGAPQAPPAAARAAASGRSFAAVLADRTRGQQPLRFSGHALDRVRRRDIAVDPATIARLESACTRVAAKGGREALVLVDDTAFVVSVRNRTVITAVDREHMREQVFTNIDSAAIA